MPKHGRLLFVVVAVVCAMGIVSAADPLKSLGINPGDAKALVLSGVETGFVYPYSARAACKAIAPAKRADVTRAILDWGKSYTESAAFKAAWTKLRNDTKPTAPDLSGSAAEDVKRQHEEQLKQLQDTKKELAGMPADQRKEMEESIDSNLKQLQATWNDPQFKKMELQAAEADRQEKTDRYKKDLADWQNRYPADPRGLIVKHLQEFLAVSATVDFDAKIVDKNGTRRFVNPEYEAKEGDWKLYYRAGRDVIAVARTFASAWLQQLQAK